MTNDTEWKASCKEWDDAADSFDNEPDHGLRDPATLSAWTTLLRESLAPVSGAALDIGCGTGSLSVVLASLGYQVTGVDFSPAMIERAEAKARTLDYAIQFQMMDAANPQLPTQHFDALVCRHLLWTLPDPAQVLQRWVALLKPGGRLLLIEGLWHTGAGLHAEDVLRLLPTSLTNVMIQQLSDMTDLWGSTVTDERYTIRADVA